METHLTIGYDSGYGVDPPPHVASIPIQRTRACQRAGTWQILQLWGASVYLSLPVGRQTLQESGTGPTKHTDSKECL